MRKINKYKLYYRFYFMFQCFMACIFEKFHIVSIKI